MRVVIGARAAADGEKAAECINREGGTTSVLQLDVRESSSIQTAAHAFGRITDHLDVLVNTAGIYPDKAVSILTVSRDQLTATFQSNTFGPVLVTQAFLPFLRKAPQPRIINLSSGYGQLSGLSPDVPSYCLSKLALNGVTLMLAKALQADKIAANAMCPG